MKKAINFKLALNALFWPVVHSILYHYVNWERMWYTPKCKFKKGDLVKINWKAKIFFKRHYLVNLLPTQPMIFDKIDNDNVVDMVDKTNWNLYWLRRAL